MRQPLKRLFVIVVSPLSRGCMQVAKREYSKTGRDASSARRRSTSHTSLFRLPGSASADCWSITRSVSVSHCPSCGFLAHLYAAAHMTENELR